MHTNELNKIEQLLCQKKIPREFSHLRCIDEIYVKKFDTFSELLRCQRARPEPP